MNDRKQRERDYHDRVFAEGGRENVGKFYAVADSIRKGYDSLLMRYGAGKRVLEIGCGPGGKGCELAKMNAAVTAIDISGVAVEKARERAAREGVTKLQCLVMDAEWLSFGDESFDCVCGTGIIHHLDIAAMYAETARVLDRDGAAVFIEPLGHNPLINLYRALTPGARTDDEHPLLDGDLRLARAYFERVDIRYYYLATLAAVPLRNTPLFKPARVVAEAFDRALFTVVPPLRKYAWMALITLGKPVRGMSIPKKFRRRR